MVDRKIPHQPAITVLIPLLRSIGITRESYRNARIQACERLMLAWQLQGWMYVPCQN